MARGSRHVGEDGGHRGDSARRQRGRRAGAKQIQPPLTPMIDVTFQLLIFFLLACQFRLTERQIQATLPDISGPQVAPPIRLKPIQISLTPVGEGVRYEVGQVRTVEVPEDLYQTLKGLLERFQSDQVPVIVKPAGEVRWGHVVEAFTQAARAKFKNIAFAPAET